MTHENRLSIVEADLPRLRHDRHLNTLMLGISHEKCDCSPAVIVYDNGSSSTILIGLINIPVFIGRLGTK